MFTLKIKTDNAAFDDPEELTKILKAVAAEVYMRSATRGAFTSIIRDANGNTVGEWKLTQ